ncbi:hypothetical protein [Paenibacillus sp. MBLB4367]|uniref:hypothetical protein n=1 Tax=Paenibacillus sp. MBLB4367 TaxID=3384767 RepID=UPI003907F1BB
MNRITGVMKIHYRDKWLWVYLPWIIMMSSFVINVIISLMIDETINSGGISSIFVFMLVAGTLVLSQTFPFAIGFSIRRTDFYKGTLAMAGVVSGITSAILLILALLEDATSGWGTGLHFFSLPYVNDGSAIQQFLIYFILLVHMFMLGFAISSVYRRYGRTGMFTFFIASFLVLTVVSFLSTYYKWWGDIFVWLGDHTAFGLAIWMVPPVVLYVLVSYMLLRKSSV